MWACGYRTTDRGVARRRHPRILHLLHEPSRMSTVTTGVLDFRPEVGRPRVLAAREQQAFQHVTGAFFAPQVAEFVCDFCHKPDP